MKCPHRVSSRVALGLVVMSSLMNQSIAAEDEEVSLAFLEFLGDMVEAKDDYITPMELYEYENLAEKNEVEAANASPQKDEQTLDEVQQ